MSEPPPTAPPEPRTPRRSPSSALPWQAIVAATVLAVTAAGMVLLFASSDDDDVVVGSGAESSSFDDAPSVTLRPVDQVPAGDPLDIEFTGAEGGEGAGTVSGTIRDLLGDQPVVVNFFASWCPPCIAEMPDFEAVSQQLGSEVRFLGLAVTDRSADAQDIVDRTGISYDWSRDARGDIAARFGISSMPSTVFIAPDGEIVQIRAGAVDADELRALIEEHLGVAA